MKIDLNTGGFVIEITIAVKQLNQDPAPEIIVVSESKPEQAQNHTTSKKRGRPTKNFVFNLEAFENENAWREKLSGTLNLTNEQIDERLNEFISFCQLTGKEHTKMHEAKAHFYNWVKRRADLQKSNTPIANVYNPTDDDKRAQDYIDYFKHNLEEGDNGH